jgi:hypothetical protein
MARHQLAEILVRNYCTRWIAMPWATASQSAVPFAAPCGTEQRLNCCVAGVSLTVRASLPPPLPLLLQPAVTSHRRNAERPSGSIYIQECAPERTQFVNRGAIYGNSAVGAITDPAGSKLVRRARRLA